MRSKKALLSDIKGHPVFFISPHLDDAVLSCGLLLPQLAKKTDVTIITVFSTSHTGRMTFSARRFVQKCGKNSAKMLFEDRRQEDTFATKVLKVNHLHLNYTDGTWRKYKKTGFLRRILGGVIPEFAHLYPTFLHIGLGRIHPQDHKLKATLANHLHTILPEDAVIFAPLAVGNHVDHVLIRETLSQFPNVIYWSDFPYNLIRKPSKRFIQQKHLHPYEIDGDFTLKQKAIKAYVSQLPTLFLSKKIPYRKETYFMNE